MENILLSGWGKYETKKNDELNENSWFEGFFAESHDGWDGITRVRNFHELRQRDLMLFSLGNINGKKVLDVGCGSAEYLTIVGKMGAEFVGGQDIGEENIKDGRSRLKECGINSKLVVGDAINLDFPDNYFDSAFSSDFFEHISLEKKEKVIAEVFRVLKPGGVFTIKTPNLTYLKVIIYIKRFINILTARSPFIYIAHTKNNPDNQHHGLTTFAELESLLEGNFFHTPKIIFVPLVRKRLPKVVSRLLFRKKIFTESIIITTRKALFYGYYK